MPPLGEFGTRNSGWLLDQAALACVVTLLLLLIRVTKGFPRASHLRSTINCAAQHDHRQCFDHDSPRWVSPSTSPVPAPRPEVGIRLSHTPGPFLQITLRGFHYNRPP